MADVPFVVREQNGVVVFGIRGYFTGKVGEALKLSVEDHLKTSHDRFIFDFSACDTVNSPGITMLFEISIRITEEMMGTLVFCAVSPLLVEVFTMAGVFPMAGQASDLASAFSLTGKRT